MRLIALAILLFVCSTLLPAARCLAQEQPFDGTVATSQPSQDETARTPMQLQNDFLVTTRQLQELLPPQVLASPNSRAEFAARAIPVLYHRLQLVDQLGKLKLLAPINQTRTRSIAQAMLYLLEDPDTQRRVNSMIDSSDPARKLGGEMIKIQASWIGAGNDEDQQSSAVDELEKLDKASPGEIRLTQLTLTMADGAASPVIEMRLLHLVADVMTDPLARTQKVGLKAQLAAEEKQQKRVGQPITITGKTVDGNDFSTANWKGKVILVDFWATWCGPCKAELPRVQEMFNAYHSKGLEIVGVSSDATAQPVVSYTNDNNLPWPELWDPQTATARLHPLCAQYDITGIPVMFIIDKSGTLRSVAGWKQMDAMIPKLLGE
jgi:thiol-disulfide isomerase/thioredoxin